MSDITTHTCQGNGYGRCMVCTQPASHPIHTARRPRWSDLDAYPAWAYVDEPWARDGMPDDPSADAAERLTTDELAAAHDDDRFGPQDAGLQPQALTPVTVPAGSDKACWLNYEPIKPGTLAYTDEDHYMVCNTCAEHCVTCTDADCDHPNYTYATTDTHSGESFTAAGAGCECRLGPDCPLPGRCSLV